MTKWVRRAFLEEYKMSDDMYYDMVDESSLRCISVDFESDRYNFALFCTIQLRYDFEEFYEKIKLLLQTEEAVGLKAIRVKDIPEILLTYADPELRAGYHLSTYLRLLLFYMHKYGYGRAERKILDAYQAQQKREQKQE